MRVELGSVEVAILGCIFLFLFVFSGCFRNVSTSRQACRSLCNTAVATAVDVPSDPPPSSQCCFRCRQHIRIEDDVYDTRDEGVCNEGGEVDAGLFQQLAEKSLDDSSWVLKQYYSGLGEEAEDNISDYSAK